MKVSQTTLDALVADFAVLLAHYGIAPDALTLRDQYDLSFARFSERKYDDSHPRFRERPRLLPYTPDIELYPDGTNDATMLTATKAALKILASR
jgi:hypothetical protein